MKPSHITTALLALLLSCCVQQPSTVEAPERIANFAYTGSFFSFNMPSPDDLAVHALDKDSVDFSYTDGHPRYSVFISIQRGPVKETEEFLKGMVERGLRPIEDVTLPSGDKMRGWALDLLVSPDENTAACSLQYIYAATMEDTIITLNYSASQDIPLGDDWKGRCPVYQAEGHERILNVLKEILKSYRPGPTFG